MKIVVGYHLQQMEMVRAGSEGLQGLWAWVQRAQQTIGRSQVLLSGMQDRSWLGTAEMLCLRHIGTAKEVG
jgi:hypothetical protein